MLPIEPESATLARRRWPQAVEKVWNWYRFEPPLDQRGQPVDKEFDRPGLYRSNVFDFHDGLRMIVSVDHYSFGNYLHVSSSVAAPGSISEKYMTGKIDNRGVVNLMIDRIRFVGNAQVTLGFWRGPPDGPTYVFHFFEPALPPEAVADKNGWNDL
jgi:hypothetical protein